MLYFTGPAILAVSRHLRGAFNWGIDTDGDVVVGVDIHKCFGCFKAVSKSVQILLNGREAVLVRRQRYP